MGCGRSLYQAAHDGLLPRFFQHTNRHGAPDYAMAFNLACSVVVVFIASPLEIYIFSNMGYLLSVCLALFGYFLHRQRHPDVPRPVRMPGFLRYVALAIGVAVLFVWIYGGYHASDLAVGPGKRVAVLPGAGDHPAVSAALRLPALRRRRGGAAPRRGRRDARLAESQHGPMLITGIKSRPVYATLAPDPAAGSPARRPGQRRRRPAAPARGDARRCRRPRPLRHRVTEDRRSEQLRARGRPSRASSPRRPTSSPTSTASWPAASWARGSTSPGRRASSARSCRWR